MKRVPSIWIVGVVAAGGILVSSVVSGVASVGTSQVASQNRSTIIAQNTAVPGSAAEAHMPAISR